MTADSSVVHNHKEFTMKITNLLIHLQNNAITAFSNNANHIKRIREALPDTSIVVAVGKTDFMEKLSEAECALVWSFKPDWYERAPKLKAVYTPAAGHDWVAADPTGRVKTFYGSFHGRIMRESLLSMMLYFNRKTGKSLDDQKHKIWGRNDYSSCVALFSQHVLIIGCGALGISMAELLKAFGSTVTGVRRTLSEGLPPHIDRVVSFDCLEEVLPLADHIVLVLPGGMETEGIIARQHFDSMKPGAFLYNLGRGNCYDNDDLLYALTLGNLAGAGLDVFSEEPLPLTSPLWDLQNVLITPHSSAISQEYIDLFIQEWLEVLREF